MYQLRINHLRGLVLLVALELLLSERWLVVTPFFSVQSRTSYLIAIHILLIIWALLLRYFLKTTDERSPASLISMALIWIVFMGSILPIVATCVGWVRFRLVDWFA